MVRSQGSRSSSVSGVPADIFAMFAGGWKSSASANGTRSRCARAAPTTVFPEPDTPIITTRGGWSAVVMRDSFVGCGSRHRGRSSTSVEH